MLEQVVAYIDRHQLLPEQGEIIVAVSGGADSLCLLHLLNRLCGPGKHYPGVSLHAAHLDHMLRGAESARDAQAVAELLASWEIPLTLGVADVPDLARAEKRSLEDAARVARYRFLREVAGGQRIAVAHHANDQVETLLLHWVRGSGLAGLVGMPPRQQDIIRPLLETTRAETVAYCQEHDIIPLEDHSNSDPRFLRNRIRHEVIPLLQELNPSLQRTLLRNAEVMHVDLEWLETQVDDCWAGVVVSEEENTIKLNMRALLALPLSLQRHLLRRVGAHLCKGQSPFEPRHLLLIQQLLSNRGTGLERTLHLPQKIQVHVRAGHAIFVCKPLPTALEPGQEATHGEIALTIPGMALIPGTPWAAQTEVLSAPLTASVIRALRQENWEEVWRILEQPTRYTIYLDGETIGAQLLVRTRQPGDRIQPLGMTGEKKVQDVFVDNHISREERATTPLFFEDAHCLWVAGLCIDHRSRMTRNTRRIIRLSIQLA